ncbi:hypothetical protein Ciccas_006478 [Cichlidogyrus casuarinus]|uniref:Cilia- and flagella-associated protein 157 n=1 Tax=Cichlidogyrus casuarinus TaxID=1844966 RepID=A0ABD2Q5M5_9PLAT
MEEEADAWNPLRIGSLLDALCSGVNGAHALEEQDLAESVYVQLVGALESRVKRYSDHLSILKQQHECILQQFSTASRVKKEEVSFLQKALRERDEEICLLIQDFEKGELALQLEREQYAQKLASTRTNGQEKIKNLESEIKKLSKELKQYEDFQQNKEKLLNNYKMLETRLANIKAEHEIRMGRLSEKDFVNRNRLKTNSVHRVNHMANEFRKYARETIPDTTKRTILENVTREVQLTKMETSLVELQEENERLEESLKKMDSDKKRIKESIDDFAKKDYAINKGTVTGTSVASLQLSVMLKQRMNELRDNVTRLETELQAKREHQAEIRELTLNCETMKKKVDAWESRVNSTQKYKKSLQRKMKRFAKKFEFFWRGMAETSEPLQNIMKEDGSAVSVSLDAIVASLTQSLNKMEDELPLSDDSASDCSSIDSDYLKNTFLNQPLESLCEVADQTIKSLSDIEISEPESEGEEGELSVSDIMADVTSPMRVEETDLDHKLDLNRYQKYCPEWQKTLAILAELRPNDIGPKEEEQNDFYLPEGILNLVPAQKPQEMRRLSDDDQFIKLEPESTIERFVDSLACLHLET